ncbi:MAG: sulfite exporter TauE/SafE family protein [Pseudomonadales bacterium]
MIFEQLLLAIVSLLANTLSSLAGGGAGLLQLPALLFLGLPFPMALATHKIASVFLGVGASLNHWKNSKLSLWFSLFILATGLPGVVIGASWVLAVPDQVANIALGVLTIGLALYSFFKPELGQTHHETHRDIKGLLIGGAGLFFIGALNGSLTSGTGLFVTIWLVRWFGLDYKQAVAYTLVLVGLFWNGSGALTLAVQTDVKWSWLPVLIVASFVGGYLGAHWGRIKGNRVIKRAFEIITFLTGLSLILKVVLS